MPDRPSPQPAQADPRPRALCALPLEALTLVLLGCGAGALSAGPLADPTRPPSSLAAAAHGATPVARPAGSDANPGRSNAALTATTALPAAAPAPLAGLLLQSVQSPARGPALAMINGQLVKVGDAVAGRQVVSIDAQGVLLRGPDGSERLPWLGDSPKQQAGSILTSQGTQFTPTPDGADPAAPREAMPRAERNSPPSALSLARKAQP